MSTSPAEGARSAACLDAVLSLAESCDYEEEHSRQVTRLALLLFDALEPLHRLGARERFWLQCAGLLHDIGWVEGQQAHHKTALRTILRAPGLPFDTRERFVIGSIARYHRKALPSVKHDHYASLKPADRAVVSLLGGILRVADGLDRTHQSVVEELTCDIAPRQVTVQCRVRFPAPIEAETALAKGDLLAQALVRKLVVECRT